MGQAHWVPPRRHDHGSSHINPIGPPCPECQILKRVRLHRVGGTVVFGRPNRIEAQGLDKVPHVEGIVHIFGVRDFRRAVIFFFHEPTPVALVVPGYHYSAVH